MIRWLHGLWVYYLAYTRSPIHAASAAAFAIFGLLVFVDPLFAVLAIASYVLPPVVLYALETEPPEHPSTGGSRAEPTIGPSRFDTDFDANSHDSDTDSDSDSDTGDTDSDRDT